MMPRRPLTDRPLALTAIVGRLTDASNITLLAADDEGTEWIYKPGSGERALWDFPGAKLWRREIAFYELDRHLGFGVVPETVEAVGPLGVGSAQRFVPWDTGFDPRTLLDPPDPRLWPITVLDIITNNADRKLGHVLVDGHRLWAIDNGLTFHPEDKLRTVLWMFAGAEVPRDILDPIRDLIGGLSGELGDTLRVLVGEFETEVLAERVRHLVQSGRHPKPPENRHAVPWPLW